MASEDDLMFSEDDLMFLEIVIGSGIGMWCRPGQSETFLGHSGWLIILGAKLVGNFAHCYEGKPLIENKIELVAAKHIMFKLF